MYCVLCHLKVSGEIKKNWKWQIRDAKFWMSTCLCIFWWTRSFEVLLSFKRHPSHFTPSQLNQQLINISLELKFYRNLLELHSKWHWIIKNWSPWEIIYCTIRDRYHSYLTSNCLLYAHQLQHVHLMSYYCRSRRSYSISCFSRVFFHFNCVILHRHKCGVWLWREWKYY